MTEVGDDRTATSKPTHPLHKVFTGEVPFGKNNWLTAETKIGRGERPKRPKHSDFTESLWELTQRCWSDEPQHRPNIKEVIEVLKDP